MAGKYGYEELKKVAFFALSFGESLSESYQGSSLLAKAIPFLSSVDEAAALLTLNHTQLKNEFSELDVEDRASLLAECATEFDLEDENLEAKVEASIAAGFQIMQGIQAAVLAWSKK